MSIKLKEAKKHLVEIEQLAFTARGLVEQLEKEQLAKKPKLRHGDYGYQKHHVGASIITLHDGQNMRSWVKKRKGIYDHNADIDWYDITGNIFDDLKRNAVDLTEFELQWEDGEKCIPRTKVQILPSGQIRFLFLSTESEYDVSQFERLCKNGLQLIATAKRKQA